MKEGEAREMFARKVAFLITLEDVDAVSVLINHTTTLGYFYLLVC